ncbi:hypothetical protein SLEP1_g53540 [Rubroshorea leprosula]|uniref:PGG domain-containing protein n=1 Tax=Rubroshorea leprosula TaxID=152421 RepID=A0AAV5MD90_9ROSI|nr:hypothetical protein SLEP1_g53540 [Rubroshorea leprosula]
MRNAISKGKYYGVQDLIGSKPDAISITFENGQTALHIAITAGQKWIAKALIDGTNSANSHHLNIKDKNGNTALSYAARSGMMEIAKRLIKKNENLLAIPNGDNILPVQLACRAGHEDMTRHLYRNTLQQGCLKGDYGFNLLEECITKKMFDIALHLLHSYPKFAIYRFYKEGTKPIILTFAQTPSFVRENQLAFWRRWIYKCTRVKVDKGSVLSDGVGSVAAQRRATKIYDLKLMDAIAREIMHFICRKLSALDEDEFVQSGAVEATFQAIKNGIPEIAIEIAIEIAKINTDRLWTRTDPEDERNMFACAVAHRQEEVAQFLYGFNARIDTNIVFTKDRDGNNLLHLAAKLAPRSDLDHISGAARLQSELRWFNAVKGIVPHFYNYQKNFRGETPSQVFFNEHEKLLKEAEEWVKKTAESSTVVGTLIITIMFAVAFTVPGGNDQNTGFPIFLNKTTDSSTVPSPTVPFMIFVASDAISLFAASSSVLMFLGILASRYAYEDFFKSLPVKLIIGISSLFISIAAMMVAFCVALFIMLQGRLWIIIPVTLLAGFPIIIFVLLLSPFLVELYTMTFGPDIFDRKRKRWNDFNNRFWLSKLDSNRKRP